MKMESPFRNISLYSVIGVSATAVEWLVFFILNQMLGLHYAPAVVLSTVFSGITNWAVGRLLLFRCTGHVFREIGSIYLASIIGMGMNLMLMWVMVGRLGIHEMLAKVLATLLVFAWNYLIQTRVIYRGKIKHHSETKPF
nr:GtrA family protein [Clostridia bacterium]